MKNQRKSARGAQPVADLISKLLNPVIELRAGMTMDLIASWEDIVGERHGTMSRPEKLQWPRRASDDEPFAPATLILACESAHALFLQHDSSTIINEINSYFGFSAVAKLKLVQKPIERSSRSLRHKRGMETGIDAKKRAHLDVLLQQVDDPKLRYALKKVGEGVFSHRSAKKG